MQEKFIKIYKQIRFVIKNITRIIFGFIVGLFLWRDNNIILIGNCPIPVFKTNGKKEQFLHNTKYLYLYLNAINTDLKFVYLCDEKDRAKKMQQCRLKNICKRNSLQGIYYALRAKYWITDYDIATVANPWFAYGATVINLWHGIPLKKIGDDTQYKKDVSLIINKLWDLMRVKEDYIVANCEYEQSCYNTAFLLPKEKIKIIGSPRLDVLFRDFKGQDLFMEEDFQNIKHFKENDKKLFLYMPTFRDTGKDVSNWLKSEKIKHFLQENNAILICKLHIADKNSANFPLDDCFYKMDKASDVYPIMRFIDVLVTDYSSINFEYLLLDKPIIYHVPDLEEYQEKCRDFYLPYKKFAVGEISKNENELFIAMQKVKSGIDEYKEQRKQLRNKMFKYQDGHNCERVVEWIRSL